MEQQYTYKYPHPAVTTDCVIFGFDGRDLKVLLIERGLEPFKGCWAFPGGFMNIDETAEQCALRELKEETGLEPVSVEQFHAFSDVERDPRERVVTIAYYALVKQMKVQGGDDANDARWFNIDEMPKLAFDHEQIFQLALRTLRERIHFQPIGFDLLDEFFTMPELQRLYEVILDVQFDRRNFQKKILQLGIVEALDEDEVPVCSNVSPENDDILCAEKVGQIEPQKSENNFMTMSFCVASRNFIDDIDKVYEKNEESQKLNSRGRNARRFRFKKTEYEEMKKNGKFKIEF